MSSSLISNVKWPASISAPIASSPEQIACPQDGANGQVHHQQRHRIERRGQAPRGNRRLCLVGGSLVKTLLLMRFAHKGTHHAHARKPLAADERNAVELLLHLFEIRHAACHHDPEDNADERRGNQEDQPELHIDKKRCDHGSDCQKRPANQLANAQGNRKLYLVYIVGDARDKRGRTEAIELGIRKLVDMLVKLPTDHRAHALRRKRSHLLTYKRKEDAQGGHSNEQQAVHHHRVDITRTHTTVDHASDNKRSEQVEKDLDQLAGRTDEKVLSIRPGITFKQLKHAQRFPFVSRQHDPPTCGKQRTPTALRTCAMAYEVMIEQLGKRAVTKDALCVVMGTASLGMKKTACTRWIRMPVRGSLWLLPPGPDQIRNISSPEPIERTRRCCYIVAAPPLRVHIFMRGTRDEEESYSASTRAMRSQASSSMARGVGTHMRWKNSPPSGSKLLPSCSSTWASS